MKKADREKLERATRYRVQKAFGATGDVYEVRRFVSEEPAGLYHVTLNLDGDSHIIWCDCPGFKRQKYAHMEHKHIKLVLHFQALERADKIAPPAYATYRIKGTGANATIHHQLTAWEDDPI